MGMTMAEKILATHSGKDSVAPGEFVTADLDGMMGNDSTFRQALEFIKEAGLDRVADPEKVVGVIDHWVPAMNVKDAENHLVLRALAKEFGIRHLYDAGSGIEHTLMVQEGHALPGDLVVGADSHTTTYGAVACAGTGLGFVEMAYAMYKGSLWFQVPETIRFVLDGEIQPGVASKDVMLSLMGRYGTDKAQYKAVEFVGPVADALSVEARLTMSNIGVEMGTKFAFFAADEKTVAYLTPRTEREVRIFGPDADAHYAEEVVIDCSAIEPTVAFPHNPDNVKPISEIGDVPVHQAFIGSCTNSRTEDLELAAQILKGRKVAEGTRFLVIPSSHEVMENASRNGSLAILIEAGAMIGTPSCGPCGGCSTGVLGPGENGIATTNRNFKGRMGSPEAFNHLASPQTVAASAIEGKIADPRKYL